MSIGRRAGCWSALAVVAVLLWSAFHADGPAAEGVAAATAPPLDVAYLALGDSVAAGVGASPPSERGYAAQLADRLDAFFGVPVRRINLAVPGETTTSLLNGGQMTRALRVLESARRTGVAVRTITLTIGANDMLHAARNDGARAAALKTVDENLRTILQRLRLAAPVEPGSTGPDLLVTGYYDPTGSPPEIAGSDGWWLARLDDTLETVSREMGATWVDIAAVFAGRSDDLTWYPRDIHPTEAGHAVIADAIWAALRADPGRMAESGSPTAPDVASFGGHRATRLLVGPAFGSRPPSGSTRRA